MFGLAAMFLAFVVLVGPCGASSSSELLVDIQNWIKQLVNIQNRIEKLADIENRIEKNRQHLLRDAMNALEHGSLFRRTPIFKQYDYQQESIEITEPEQKRRIAKSMIDFFKEANQSTRETASRLQNSPLMAGRYYTPCSTDPRIVGLPQGARAFLLLSYLSDDVLGIITLEDSTFIVSYRPAGQHFRYQIDLCDS